MRKLFISISISTLSITAIGQKNRFFDIEADQIWKNPALTGTGYYYSDLLISGGHRFDNTHLDTIRNQSNHQFAQSYDNHSLGMNYYHTGLYHKSYSNTYAFGGAYSYNFEFDKFDFNVGTYVGFSHTRDKFLERRTTTFDMNVGVAFHTEDWRAGISFMNISNPNYKTKRYLDDAAISMQYQHLFIVSSDFDLEPTAFLFLQSGNSHFHVGFNAIWDELVSFGTFYRSDYRTGINLNFLMDGGTFQIGYTYEYDFKQKFNSAIIGNHCVKIQFNM